MASRFWVGGTGTWDGSSTTHWSSTTGGSAGASAPVAGDTAVFDASSGLVSGSVVTIASGAVCSVWNVTGPAVKAFTFTLSANFSPSTSVSIAGNSAINRVFVASNTAGTARTITTALATLSNVDFQDIAGSGTGSPFAGTSIGDCQGNSGITFTAAATQTATGTVSFSWSTHGWTSRVPLPQDDVVIPNAFAAGRTITADMPRLGRNIDCSSSTGAPTFSWSIATTSYGNVSMPPGGSASGSTNTWTLAGRGTQTITNNSVTWANTTRLTVSATGGSYTLTDTLTQAANGSPSNLVVAAGSFATGNFNMTVGQLTVSAGATATFGTSTVTLNTSGTGASAMTFSGTVSAASATFLIGSTTSGTITFTGGGQAFGTLTHAGAGVLLVAGSNTITTVNVSSGRVLTFTSGTTTTVTNWNTTGQVFGYQRPAGATGQWIGVPDSVALSPTTALTLDAKVAMDNWAATGTNELISKVPVATNYTFDFYLSSGSLVLRVSTDGSTFTTFTSSAAVTYTAGQTGWVRASYVNTNGTNSVVQFFTSPDGVTWTQLGTNRTGAILASMFDSTGILEIGSAVGGQNPGVGNFYQAKLYKATLGSTSGTPDLNVDFTTKAFGADSFTESSANAATVTMTGTLAQVGDGRVVENASAAGSQATIRRLGGLISMDYAKIKDIAFTGGVRAYAGSHSIDDGNNTGVMWGAPHKTDFFRMFSERKVGV